MNKVFITPHCEDYSCDLGSVDFDCPVCSKTVTDYDCYMYMFELHTGGIYELKCPHCKKELEVYSKEYNF